MTQKVKVRPAGDFIFYDIRTGEHAFPGVDTEMTRSAILEGKIWDGLLILVEDEPDPNPAPKPKSRKAQAE